MGERVPIDAVLDALRAMDTDVSGRSEADVQAAASDALARAMVRHRREVTIGAGSRVDLLTECGIGVEVKIGAWQPGQVLAQLERYAASDRIAGLVLLCERGIACPPELDGKPVHVLRLAAGRRVAV